MYPTRLYIRSLTPWSHQVILRSSHPEQETLVPLVYSDSLVRLDLQGVKLVNLVWISDVVKSVEIDTILVLSSLIVLFIIVCLLQCYDNINFHLIYVLDCNVHYLL
jgi:hypothetical protein